MKEIIQKLIHGISKLKNPMDPNELSDLFASVDPTNEITIPENLESIWKKLLELKLKTNNLKRISKIQKYRDEIQTHTIKIQELKGQIASFSNDAQILYKSIYEPLCTYLSQSQSATPSDTLDCFGQRESVQNYLSQLTKIDEVNNRLQALNRIKELDKDTVGYINKVKQSGVSCSVNSGTDDFFRIITEVTNEIDQLEKLEVLIDNLQKKFASQLSRDDVKQKINDFVLEIERINAELSTINKKQTNFLSLPTSFKQQLIDEFEKCSDSNSFISSYEDKIDGITSYINPLAWYRWGQESNYNEEQKRYIDTVTFLNLLKNQRHLVTQLSQVNRHKEQLEVLKPQDSESSSTELIAEAVNIIKLIPNLKHSFNFENASAIDYFLTLIESLPQISHRKDQIKLALPPLKTLFETGKEVDSLRTLYQLWPTNDAVFLLTKNHNFKETEEGKNNRLAEIDRCTAFLNLQRQVDSLNDKCLKLKSAIKIKSIALQKNPQNLEQITTQIQELIDCILMEATSRDLTIISTSLSEPGNIHDQEVITEQATPQSPISEPSNTIEMASASNSNQTNVVTPAEAPESEIANLQFMCSNSHNSICNIISTYPEKMQQWYQDVYKVIKVNKDKNSLIQSLHFLNDILFELQKRHSDYVMEHYIKLCPEPHQGINRLLALKPEFLVSEEQITPQNCPRELLNLYQQYNRLKIGSTLEANLLMQVIQILNSLYLIRKQKNNTGPDSNEFLRSFHNDPRFIPLKRHRGFFKICEAIEDFFKLIIGKFTHISEHEYRKRPGFFRTRSDKMLEEAGLFLKSAPAQGHS
ncbi:MAG TPA: hypothetical protein PK657_11445 [Legionella sp.]|nr:hypothetical protein [Legionella sp.]